MAESYLQGVSTRRVQDIVAHLGLDQRSPSSVSRISRELDEKVDELIKRPIEHPIPYIYVDASYFKVRDGGKHVTKALLMIAGVRKDGHREILGARIADSEGEGFGSGFFDELKERDLEGVQLVTSDGYNGIQKCSSVGFPWRRMANIAD